MAHTFHACMASIEVACSSVTLERVQPVVMRVDTMILECKFQLAVAQKSRRDRAIIEVRKRFKIRCASSAIPSCNSGHFGKIGNSGSNSHLKNVHKQTS
mmetsp:Transcript_36957/g.55110  ORF Transcript_36957/g.55110 Transcript_36957/m.55110 type:complete len:99 (+) Transcript_36957:188-484(+)